MKNALCVTMIIVLVALAGCEGPEGPTGAKGKDGADGNANVVVTEKQVNPNNWVASSTGEFYIFNIPVSSINQDIVTYGSVIIYYSTDNVYWGLLPSINASTPSGDVFVIDYFYSLGSVQLQAQRVESNSASYPTNPLYLKIITITSAFLGKHAVNEIDWKNYNEVKQRFNLHD